MCLGSYESIAAAFYEQGCIQMGFATGQQALDPKFLSQFYKKLKIFE